MRRMRSTRTSWFGAVAVVAIASLLTPTPNSAQSVGDRVRVTISNGVLVGTVTGASEGSFALDTGDERSISVARDGVLMLERSLGRRSEWKRGLVTGAAIGVGGGILVGYLVGGTCDILTVGSATEECTEVGVGVAIRAGAVWGALGGLAGLGVGALIRREGWETIPHRGAGASFSPVMDMRLGRGGRPGVVLGGRIRF